MKIKHQRGLTLIETIVYITIFAVISLAAINSLIMVMNSFNKGRLWSKIGSSAESALERMTREIRLSYDIDASSNLGSHPGHLVLNTYVLGTETPTTVEFYLDSGKIMIIDRGASAVALTSDDLTITNLIFRQINASSISKAVKIEMTIQGSSGNYQKTERFYNTAILRGSY